MNIMSLPVKMTVKHYVITCKDDAKFQYLKDKKACYSIIC